MNETEEKFDNYLSDHLSQINNHSSSSNRKQWLKYNYQKYLPPNRDSKILDIGPGYGELISFLSADLGYVNVQAVDVSKEVAHFCNSIVPNSTEFSDDTIEFLRRKKDQFNVVFLLHVLEHIPKKDTIKMLSEVYSSLENNGILIVEVPNMANPIIGLNTRYADFTHEVGFTDVSLKNVLQKAGFANVSVFPSKVPVVSALRLIQFILQELLNLILKLGSNIYMPSRSQIMSPSIFAIANKTI